MAKRNADYQFISTDTSELEEYMISAYERITSETVYPASPERLFISWVANIILQERVLNNYTGNQNIPSRASGANLDALAELFYASARPDAKAAVCTVRFHISQAQSSVVIVPKGTRLTDRSGVVFWETEENAFIEIGQTFVDAPVRCMTPGTDGNGYEPGQINTLVDLYDFYSDCANITTSAGGSDKANDDEFYEILRESMDAYSTAGPAGSYSYHAKSVSTEIVDVAAVRLADDMQVTLDVYRPTTTPVTAIIGGDTILEINVSGGGNASAFIGGDSTIDLSRVVVHPHNSSAVAVLNTDYFLDYTSSLLTISIAPDGILSVETQIDVEYSVNSAGQVTIYTLMKDGTPAGEEIKSAILEACSDETVRPLTDRVYVADPETVDYNIDFTYYITSENTRSAVEINDAVNKAVQAYIEWQHSKLGRDINPSYLISLLMKTGVKRVDVRSPVFTKLKDGSKNNVPQLAVLGTTTIVNGGTEEE